MVRHADALVGFRTYPHVDMAETGARTAHLLKRILAEGKPAKAMRRTDFLVSINWQCTLVDPAKAVYAELAALEAADPSPQPKLPARLPAGRHCGMRAKRRRLWPGPSRGGHMLRTR